MRYVAFPLSDSSFASFRLDSSFVLFLTNNALFNARFSSSPYASASRSSFMIANPSVGEPSCFSNHMK